MSTFLYTLATDAADTSGTGPQSKWVGLGANLWVWQPSIEAEVYSEQVVEELRQGGMEPVPEDRAQLAIILLSQLAEVRWIAQTPTTVRRHAKGTLPPPASAGAASSPPVLWAYGEDISYAETNPVALAFGLPPSMLNVVPTQLQLLPPETLELAQVLPPPTLGEVALIALDEWHPAPMADAASDLAELQRQVASALTELAKPAGWYAYSDLFATCSDDRRFHQLLQQVQTALLAGTGRQRTRLQEQARDLELTRAHVEDLREAAMRVATQPDLWQRQVRDLHTMLQRLAALYWRAWQASHVTTVVSSRSPLPSQPIFAPQTQQVPVPSVLPVQAVLAAYSNAQSGAGRWGTESDVPRFTYNKPEGTSSLQLRPESGTLERDDAVIRSLWRQVRALSDLDGDVFLILLAQALAAPPDEHGSVQITAEQVLEARGIQPIMKRDELTGSLRRAGHRREDIVRVGECISRMGNTWLTVRQQLEVVVETKTRKRKRRKEHTLESRLIQISEVTRQRELTEAELLARPDLATMPVIYVETNDLSDSSEVATTIEMSGYSSADTSSESRQEEQILSAASTHAPTNRAGAEQPERGAGHRAASDLSATDTGKPERPPRLDVAWKISMGTWLHPYLDTPNRQLAFLVQKALQYDPVREFWAKRLARYIILNLRIKPGGHASTITTSVETLLNELSLPLSERHPQETKDHFESALDRLLEDRQIDDWHYLSQNPELTPRRWLPTWLTWLVSISVAPLPPHLPDGRRLPNHDFIGAGGGDGT